MIEIFAASLILWAQTYQNDTIPHTPPCTFVDTCRYMPNPVDGPLMPTWRTEGFYGGWTSTPVLCDPFTYECRGVNPQR